MKTLPSLGRFVTTALCLALLFECFAVPATGLAADAPRPLAPPTVLSLQEARVIIDAAVAYAREQKLTMTVVILDEEGQLISADRMEGASFHLERLPKEKPMHQSYCVIARKRPPS